MPEYCKVLHDYDKEQSDEISLTKGQILEIVKEEDEGWWEGTIHPSGHKGWFPSNFVEKCDAPSAQAANEPEAQAAPAKKMGLPFGAMAIPGMGVPPGLRKATQYGVTKTFAKVIFDYSAEKDDELSLKTGEMVEVETQEDEGWWTGILHGKQGAFPSNFVELVDGGSAPVASSKPRGPPKGGMGAAIMGAVKPKKKAVRCEVMHDYTAENNDELTLKVGDIVEITNKDVDEGWWEGISNGKTGVFPNNFVKIKEDTGNGITPSIGQSMLRKSIRKPREIDVPKEEPSFLAGQSMLKRRPPPDSGTKPFVSPAPTSAPAKPSFVKPARSTSTPPSKTAHIVGTPTVASVIPASTTTPVASVKPGTAVSAIGKFGGAPAASGAGSATTPSKAVVGAPAVAVTTNGPSAGGASSSEVKALKAEVKLLKSMLEKTQAELSIAKNDLSEIKAASADVKALKKDLEEVKSMAADVKAVKTSIGKVISGFQKDIREARDERLKLSDKVEEVQTKIQFGI